MVDPADLPAALRAQHITAWLGPRLHVVHYPVCAGQKVNVVAVVHGQPTGNPMSWTHEASQAGLAAALGPVHTHLQHMLDAVPQWRQWPLYDRPPIPSAHGHARGRVALVGDAAHPMRPYLAQGAAMALEDAWTLGELLVSHRAAAGTASPPPWAPLFQRYAQARWARNARVQASAERNGRVFHAQGWLRVARNLAMAWGGEHLLDNPWLYSGPAQPPFKYVA
jgi:salicylate hydroxylase